MRIDPAACSSVVGQNKESRHTPHRPAAFACDGGCEATLSIEREQHRLEVGDHGLDLDHEQRSGRPVEREDVDRAPFAANVEGHLGRDLPVGGTQDLEYSVDEPGVSRIEESIQTLALPEQPNIYAGIEGDRDANEGMQRYAIGMPALDPPNDGTRHARPLRELVLGPASPVTERSKSEAEPDSIHRSRMETSPCLRLMSGRAPARIASSS